MQDDLSELMSRNMHLGSVQTPMHNVSTPPTPQVMPQPAPITYISQHYHHSAHVAPTPINDEVPISTFLRENGVNADVLLPSQLQLFKNAQPDQRDRLMELWRIAPPTYGDQLVSRDMGNWPQTSLEMEEEAARYRWEKIEQDRLKNLSVLPSSDSRSNAEPYMKDGYDADMDGVDNTQGHRQATDPAYDRGREWWTMAEHESMENQYGMLQEMQLLHGFCSFNRDRMTY